MSDPRTLLYLDPDTGKAMPLSGPPDMDPREFLTVQLQRGQATAHAGRREVASFGQTPGQVLAPDVNVLTGKSGGGPPLWVWLAVGGLAAYLLGRRSGRMS